MSDDVQRTLGRIESKLDAVLEDHRDLKEGVKDWREFKNRAIGWLVGVGVMSATAGAAASKALAGLFHSGQS